jgi:hypothetical protein
LQVIELFGQACEIADAVIIAVGERLDVKLVDNSVLVPKLVAVERDRRCVLRINRRHQIHRDRGVSGGGIMVRLRLRRVRRASGGFGHFVHDGAVGMNRSHFVEAKGDAGDYIESRFPPFGSLGNSMAGESVSHFYPLSESVEFAATSLRPLPAFPPLLCKWRAEWTFIPWPSN